LYVRFLNDPSYAVIKAAATALGATKSNDAYDALVKLMNVPSWRDNIRASALSGLAELRDKRALEYGLRYSEPGNSVQARTAALRLIGQTGGNDSAAFERLATRVRGAFQSGEYGLSVAAGEALVALGNPKGLAVLEQLNGDPTITGRLKTRLGEYSEMLQKTVAGRPATGTHPNP
jgi:HEAT repeat protein